MKTILLLAAATISSTAAASDTTLPIPGIPTPGAIRQFRDWAVGCDNVKDCEAQALTQDGADNAAILLVTRTAGPGSQPAIVIPFAGAVQPMALLIDGQRLPQVPRAQDGAIRFGPIASAALVPQLLKGTRLEVIDDKGLVVAVISLAGASAALTYVDDRQGRIGTQTALVRPGTKLPTAVPPRTPPPVVAVPKADRTAPANKLAAKALAQLRADSGCALEGNALDRESWQRLDTNHSLLLLSCGSGAYNHTSATYVIANSGGKKPKLTTAPAAFDLPPPWSEDAHAPMLVNAGWDAKGGVLSSYSKGRGPGDCGSSAKYVWDGATFRMIEQRAMDECRGSIHWIRTWVADAAQAK